MKLKYIGRDIHRIDKFETKELFYFSRNYTALVSALWFILLPFKRQIRQLQIMNFKDVIV